MKIGKITRFLTQDRKENPFFSAEPKETYASVSCKALLKQHLRLIACLLASAVRTHVTTASVRWPPPSPPLIVPVGRRRQVDIRSWMPSRSCVTSGRTSKSSWMSGVRWLGPRISVKAVGLGDSCHVAPWIVGRLGPLGLLRIGVLGDARDLVDVVVRAVLVQVGHVV